MTRGETDYGPWQVVMVDEIARAAAVAACPGHRFPDFRGRSLFRGVCCEVCKQHFSAHEIHAMLAAGTL